MSLEIARQDARDEEAHADQLVDGITVAPDLRATEAALSQAWLTEPPAAMIFAAEGARVVIGDPSLRAGNDLVARIQTQGDEAAYIDCDVVVRTAMTSMVDLTRRRFGRLDCALNNSGVCLDDDARWDDEAFDKTVAIGRLTRPEELAEVALRLLSEKAGFVTSHAVVPIGRQVIG